MNSQALNPESPIDTIKRSPRLLLVALVIGAINLVYCIFLSSSLNSLQNSNLSSITSIQNSVQGIQTNVSTLLTNVQTAMNDLNALQPTGYYGQINNPTNIPSNFSVTNSYQTTTILLCTVQAYIQTQNPIQPSDIVIIGIQNSDNEASLNYWYQPEGNGWIQYSYASTGFFTAQVNNGQDIVFYVLVNQGFAVSYIIFDIACLPTINGLPYYY